MEYTKPKAYFQIFAGKGSVQIVGLDAGTNFLAISREMALALSAVGCNYKHYRNETWKNKFQSDRNNLLEKLRKIVTENEE